MEFSKDLTLTPLTQQFEGHNMTDYAPPRIELAVEKNKICLSGGLILKYFKSSSLLAGYREQSSRIHHQKGSLNGTRHTEGSEQCSWLVTVDGRALFCGLRLMVKMWLPVGKLLL